MQGKVGVRESLDWKPGCRVGCMLVKVHTVFEPGWKIFLQHYLLVRRQEIRERESICAHMHPCVSVWEIAQDLEVAPVWGCLLLIWHLVWLKSAHRYTLARRHRCAHTASSSSCSNSKALTGGQSLFSARGTVAKPVVAAGQLGRLAYIKACG